MLYQIFYDFNGSQREYDFIYWDAKRAINQARDMTSCADSRTAWIRVYKLIPFQDGTFGSKGVVYQAYRNGDDWDEQIVRTI